MGGSSSRELSIRYSKQRRRKEQSQWARQREVLPTENSPDSHNVSDSRHFDYDGIEAMTYTNNQFQNNQWDDEEFQFEMQRDLSYENGNRFYEPNRSNKSYLSDDSDSKFRGSSGDLNGFVERQSFSNDRCEERQFKQPKRRHHSFSENRLQYQSGQGSFKDLSSSGFRCNSLNDVNDRDFLFEGQYMGNRFTNFSSFNLPIQNHPFDGSTSTYDARSSVGCGEIKRYSCGNYSDDASWDDSVYDDDQMLVFDSPVEPQVKRRQSDESQRLDCLLGDNRNRSEGEISKSRQSFDSNTPSNSAASGSVRSLPDVASGALDILSFPSEWSSYTVDKTGYVNISFSSSEGKSILKFFHRTCKFRDSCLCISSIIRIENPFLHTLYLLKKEEMILRNGHVDELFLYHGTKRRHVSNICENNLDWRQYSEMHRFGKGVSFSPSATYSSHYSDDIGSDKVLMLFKVLVSKTILGLPEMKIPVDDMGESFDTSIKEDATVVVKYCDNEFYPLYKILYTKKKLDR